MFSVSTSARRALREYFRGKKPRTMRVFMKQGACGGPRLVLGMDELNDDDAVFRIEGLSYGIERNVFETIKPVTIDFVDNAFQISAAGTAGGCTHCATPGDCRS